MRNFEHPSRRRSAVRRDGWTQDKIVTFFLALAAGGSVTFAAQSVGLSRKAAYVARKRDPGFAALWNRALAASEAARLRTARARLDRSSKGDEVDEVDDPPKTPRDGNTNDDLFVSAFKSNHPAAMLRWRFDSPLAFVPKESDAGCFEERARAPLRRGSRARL